MEFHGIKTWYGAQILYSLIRKRLTMVKTYNPNLILLTLSILVGLQIYAVILQ